MKTQWETQMLEQKMNDEQHAQCTSNIAMISYINLELNNVYDVFAWTGILYSAEALHII